MHPIAFELGPLPLRWFGVFVAVGFLAGFWTAERRAARDGLAPGVIADLMFWIIFGAIAGARLAYVLTYWEHFSREPWPEMFKVFNGGLVFYGGFAGASLTTAIYARVRRLPLWKMGDAFAPSIALGSVFGRIGCYLNGCCHGQPTDAPWAVCFPHNHETRGVPVHPTQLYDSALNLALFAALAWQHRHKRFDGQTFLLFVAGYAVIRSFVEVFRGDYDAAHLQWGLTPGQRVSAVAFIIAVGLLWRWSRAAKPRSP